MDVLLPEWSPRRALVVRWPWRADIWPQQGADAQVALVETLQRLHLPLAASGMEALVQVPARFYAEARAALLDFACIQITEYADIWVRDCAPFYTSEKSWCAGFNGWDGLDPDYQQDFIARDALVDRFGLSPQTLPFVLEGGNLHTNGEGLGVYVAASVLTTTRNPSLDRDQLHACLRNELGLRDIVALDAGLHNDETGGHVDNVLTFLDPHTLALSMPANPAHPDYGRCQRIYQQLQQSAASLSGRLRVVELPLPALSLSAAEADSIRQPAAGFQREKGMSLCASYCNGIRFGDYYVVPQFDCAEDAVAMAALRRAAPKLTLVPVPARALLPGGGGWHCASHTVP
ncbi:agmatine deiminase family protein [Aliidiomarina sp. Khilg15.8]